MERSRAFRRSWVVCVGLAGVVALSSAPRAQAQDAGAAAEVSATVDAGVAGEVVATPDVDAGAPVDEAAEEAAIAAEMAAMQAAQATDGGGADSAPPASESSGSSGSSRGLSNAMNPAISAAGMFFAGYSTRGDAEVVDGRDDLETGFAIQELELAVSAIVDPYLRADLILTANLDEIGFEEALVTTLEIPRLTIRAGLFKASVGRHNIKHTHAFPFLTGPLPWRALLGPEGLSSPGVSFDLLLPLPFYAEVNAQVFAGDWAIMEGGVPDDPTTPLVDETVADLRQARDLAYVGHLRTLFDLSDATTIEVGASYVGGRNGFGGLTSVVAGDVTLKWRPVAGNRYTSFEWQSEWLWSNRAKAPGEATTGGGYTHVRYQFGQRWWVQARGAVLGMPGPREDRVYRGEALAAFIPTEFSALRLQYGLERAERSGAPFIHDLTLQLIFSMGPHPAHAY